MVIAAPFTEGFAAALRTAIGANRSSAVSALRHGSLAAWYSDMLDLPSELKPSHLISKIHYGWRNARESVQASFGWKCERGIGISCRKKGEERTRVRLQ